MKRLRLGAILHFIIAIGHVACLFALSHGAIILVLEDNEAYSKFPVSIANRIVPAFALGGCNDFALLGTLPDSRVDGYTRRFSGKAMGSRE